MLKIYRIIITKGLNLLLPVLLMSFQHIALPAEITIVSETWPPHIEVNDHGIVSGTLIDKLTQIMAAAKLSYNVNIYPWTRAYKYALSNENVLIFPIFKTKEREASFHFICPLTQKLELYFVKLSTRKDIKIKTITDAKKYRIGLIRQDYDHLLLLKHGFKDGQQLDVNSDDFSTLRKLIKGRIDLMIQSKGAIYNKLAAQGLKQSIVSFAYQLKNDNLAENCLAFSKKTPLSLVNKVKQALEKVNRSGPLLNINN